MLSIDIFNPRRPSRDAELLSPSKLTVQADLLAFGESISLLLRRHVNDWCLSPSVRHSGFRHFVVRTDSSHL